MGRGLWSRIRWWAALSPGERRSSAKDGMGSLAVHMPRWRPCAGRSACRRGYHVRYAGAVQPFRQNAALHKGYLVIGIKAGGHCHEGPVSPSRGRRSGRVAPWRGGSRIRRARVRSPEVECPISETDRDRPAVDHRQMGHVAGRQAGDCRRGKPLDIQRAITRSGSQTAGTDGRDYRGTRDRDKGRSDADRTAAWTAHRVTHSSRHPGVAFS